MKPICKTPSFLAAAALTLVLSLGGSLQAAPKKGGELLMNPPKVDPGPATQAMACPLCKNTYVTVTQPPGRGGHREVVTITKHQCPECGSEWVQSGHAKMASEKMVHACKACATAGACCAGTKSS